LYVVFPPKMEAAISFKILVALYWSKLPDSSHNNTIHSFFTFLQIQVIWYLAHVPTVR
jgi:hypothetical protein